MKKIKTDNGWHEITTVKIEINRILDTPISSAGSWVDYTNRNPKMNKKGRNHCECCGIKWCDIASDINTYIAMTTKGNKILCEDCYTNFKK
jgi:hypothetical protein